MGRQGRGDTWRGRGQGTHGEAGERGHMGRQGRGDTWGHMGSREHHLCFSALQECQDIHRRSCRLCRNRCLLHRRALLVLCTACTISTVLKGRHRLRCFCAWQLALVSFERGLPHRRLHTNPMHTNLKTSFVQKSHSLEFSMSNFAQTCASQQLQTCTALPSLPSVPPLFSFCLPIHRDQSGRWMHQEHVRELKASGGRRNVQYEKMQRQSKTSRFLTSLAICKTLIVPTGLPQ